MFIHMINGVIRYVYACVYCTETDIFISISSVGIRTQVIILHVGLMADYHSALVFCALMIIYLPFISSDN